MIPAPLLKGLYELVSETDKAEMLTGLFENGFPTWLRMLWDKINACKRISSNYENNEHYDSIVALLAASVKSSNTNVKKASEKNILPIIADIYNETN